MPTDLTGSPSRGNAGLVDVLDRVLDKGLVVAGDIKVSLAEVELLTIRISSSIESRFRSSCAAAMVAETLISDAAKRNRKPIAMRGSVLAGQLGSTSW